MLVYMNDIFLCKQINFVITNMTTLLYMRFANYAYIIIKIFHFEYSIVKRNAILT